MLQLENQYIEYFITYKLFYEIFLLCLRGEVGEEGNDTFFFYNLVTIYMRQWYIKQLFKYHEISGSSLRCGGIHISKFTVNDS